MRYLKDVLLSTPTLFSVKEIHEAKEWQKNGKSGIVIPIIYTIGPSGHGEEVEGGAFENDMQYGLKGVEVGDTVEAWKEGKFIQYRIIKNQGDQTEQPTETPYRQVKNEREVTKNVNIHDWKLGLAGMLQSYRAGGDFTIEAREKAELDVHWVRNRAEELTNPPS